MKGKGQYQEAEQEYPMKWKSLIVRPTKRVLLCAKCHLNTFTSRVMMFPKLIIYFFHYTFTWPELYARLAFSQLSTFNSHQTTTTFTSSDLISVTSSRFFFFHLFLSNHWHLLRHPLFRYTIWRHYTIWRYYLFSFEPLTFPSPSIILVHHFTCHY